MIILDISIVITALPQIERALDFSPTSLSWVQNAYTLAFGGLLLLGARAGDILGRRRMLVTGIAIFSLASLAGGLAQSEGWLLAARAVQGVGAAIAAPATLALLTVTFREGRERLRARSPPTARSRPAAAASASSSAACSRHGRHGAGACSSTCRSALAPICLAPRVLPDDGAADRPLRPHRRGHLYARHHRARLRLRPRRRGRLGRGRDARLVRRGHHAALPAFESAERGAEQPITPLRLFASLSAPGRTSRACCSWRGTSRRSSSSRSTCRARWGSARCRPAFSAFLPYDARDVHRDPHRPARYRAASARPGCWSAGWRLPPPAWRGSRRSPRRTPRSFPRSPFRW